MTLDQAIEIICGDYCKYSNTESGNKLADICDKCLMNKCEDLRWANCKTELIQKEKLVWRDGLIYIENEP